MNLAGEADVASRGAPEELPAETTKGHEEILELLCCEDHIDVLLSFLNPQWDRDINFPSHRGNF